MEEINKNIKINSELPPIPSSSQISNSTLTAPLQTVSPNQEPGLSSGSGNHKNNTSFYVVCSLIIFLLLSTSLLLIFKSADIANFVYHKVAIKPKEITQVTHIQETSPTNIPTAVSNEAAITPDKTATMASLTNLSPRDTYLILKAEEDNLNDFNGYYEFAKKYVSTAKMAEINSQLNQVNLLPSGFFEQVISVMKSTYPQSKDIRNIETVISGNKATLTVLTNKPNQKGTIDLILEKNVWKLDNELWTEKTQP
jgi:hypothetical protein